MIRSLALASLLVSTFSQLARAEAPAQAPAQPSRADVVRRLEAATQGPITAAICRARLSTVVNAVDRLTTKEGVTAENRAGFIWLAQCGTKLKIWDLVYHVGSVKNFPWPAMQARAAIGMGKYELAAKLAKASLATHPTSAEAHLTLATAHCYVEEWAGCNSSAEAALKHFVPETAKQLAPDAIRLKVEALFHLGKLKEAARALDIFSKARPGLPQVDTLRRRNAIVTKSRLIVDRVIDKHISLGLYHLYVTEPHAFLKPLVHLKLYNLQPADRQVRIEVAIDGVTEKVTKTAMLLKGRRVDVRLSPSLRADFKTAEIRADRPSQVSVKITALDKQGEQVVYEKNVPIKLLPRDSLLFSRSIGDEASESVYQFAAAWVTPNARAVESFITAAKKRLAAGDSFSGEQTDTVAQVKALWEELHARGVSYVSDPNLSLESGYAQRTRLPTEVLSSTNAQCVEGSVLIASLMEAIGLRPFLVIVPGHMFVGWHATAQDGVPAGRRLYLETTMVKSGAFESAMKRAAANVDLQSRRGYFNNGRARILDIAELRKLGIKAQPLD